MKTIIFYALLGVQLALFILSYYIGSSAESLVLNVGCMLVVSVCLLDSSIREKK